MFSNIKNKKKLFSIIIIWLKLVNQIVAVWFIINILFIAEMGLDGQNSILLSNK